MAKVPVKKFVPKMSLTPGEKQKIAIAAKIKLTKINKIRAELTSIERIAETYPPSAKMSKKLASLKAELDANHKAQMLLLKKATEEVAVQAADTDVGKLLKTVEKECSDVLAAFRSSKTVLYRGVKSGKTNPPAYVGRSRSNRQTLNSTSQAQQVYDVALQKMGITALRSNSIFTTTDLAQASGYGNALYVIIPKNGFQFSWTTEDPDVVIDDASKLFKEDVLDKVDASVTRFLGSKTPVNVFSDNLRYRGYEYAIAYLKGINFPPATIAKIRLEALIDYDYIKGEMGPTNKNFKAALANGGEVLISGEYYAFNTKKYGQLLKTLLKLTIIQ